MKILEVPFEAEDHYQIDIPVTTDVGLLINQNKLFFFLL